MPNYEISEEDFHIFRAWQKLNGQAKSSSSSTISLPDTVRARVSVRCDDEGCEGMQTGFEIMAFEVTDTFIDMGVAIKNFFRDLQDVPSKERPNVRHCLWSKDHKIDSIKVNWSGVHGNGWNDNGDTFVTNSNCKDVLIMMADRKSVDSLIVTISSA